MNMTIWRKRILKPTVNINGEATPVDKVGGLANIAAGDIKQPSRCTTEMPEGAVITGAEPSRRGGFNVYFLCDPKAKLVKRAFILIRTGVEVPEAILDCTPVKCMGGASLFEVPAHQAQAFKDVDTLAS